MDCESAQSAAGIDPKILDSYQSDAVFTIPWENTSYDQPLDWDASQDSNSNQSDSEFADLTGNSSLLGNTGDYYSDDSRYGLFRQRYRRPRLILPFVQQACSDFPGKVRPTRRLC